MATNKIAIRRDTAANWTAANPTLVAGEFGFETDTRRMKLGDGATAWTSLGHLTYGVNASDNIVVPAGKGIDFSAAAGSAAGATSSVLDDYEEGTWTPVLTGSTSGTLNGTGHYTKIGDTVHVYIIFAGITTATKPLGEYAITGLPFPARNRSTGEITPGTITTARVTFDSARRLGINVTDNTTVIGLLEEASNALGVAVTDANFVNADTMFFRIQLTYSTTS